MAHKRWSTLSVIAVALVALAGGVALVLAPRPAAESTVFVGHYGYSFRLTANTTTHYKITSAFRDEKRTAEVVFVHPKKLDPDAVFRTPESEYAGLGVLRLEVNPNSAYPAKAQDKLVEAFKYAAAKTLDERKEKYVMKELVNAPLPGFAIEIQTAQPVAQVFMKGREVHYLVTASPENPALHEILSSLADAPAPGAAPAGAGR